MKHIFYIHSFITYLSALGVIENKNIKDDAVLFLYVRGCFKQSRFRYINVNDSCPELFGLPCYASRFFYVRNWSLIKFFDKLIDSFCENDNYVCYLPSNGQYLQQLLSTHHKCVRLHFIEEGLFSYNDTFRKKNWPFYGILGSVKKYLNTGNRVVNPDYIVKNSILYILFDVKNYSGPLQKKCIMPNINKIPYDGPRLSNANVLMMNAFRDASAEVIDDLLKILYRFAQRQNKPIYIKHHPYSSKEFKLAVENVFRLSGVEFYVLDDFSSTELLLWHSNELSVYGFFSATMLYAVMFGHKAYSFLNLFRSMSDNCAHYLDVNFHVPVSFLDNVDDYVC